MYNVMYAISANIRNGQLTDKLSLMNEMLEVMKLCERWEHVLQRYRANSLVGLAVLKLVPDTDRCFQEMATTSGLIMVAQGEIAANI